MILSVYVPTNDVKFFANKINLNELDIRIIMFAYSKMIVILTSVSHF